MLNILGTETNIVICPFQNDVDFSFDKEVCHLASQQQ